MFWSVDECRELAEERLVRLAERWQHVNGVACRTESWLAHGYVSDMVVKAAWLHDVGYSDQLALTGMHAIDGARYLDLLGLDKGIVSLIAHHTGAWFEAEERGLTDAMLAFDLPHPEDLDALTLADLVTGTTGERVTLGERFQGIFKRYEPGHPVHRAMTRSRESLTESAVRAAARIGYPM